MTDILDNFLQPRRPSADRPLLGQTVLVVEDSRFAGETLRLICLRGGARIRRADSLRAAARHLASFRPTVVVVDLGLPDGSGLDLISRLSAATPRIPVLLATSGDPMARADALAAGADDFLAKPMDSVAALHAAILACLPATARPTGPRSVPDEIVVPDAASLGDDYALILDLLDPGSPVDVLRYAAGFASSLAHSTDDTALLGAANDLDGVIGCAPCASACATLSALVQERLRLPARRTG